MEQLFKYNHKDWPRFTYMLEPLTPLLAEIYKAHGRIEGRFDLAALDVSDERITEILSQDVLDNAGIEGQVLDPEDVRRSVRKSLGLEQTQMRFKSEGNTMVLADALLNRAPLSRERLCQWHRWYFPNGNPDDPAMRVGEYARERMEIRSASGKIVYQAPPVERLAQEMNMFFFWLDSAQLDIFIKAGIAHLWFEIIHPFGDGNGRIGRHTIDYVLAGELQDSLRTIGLSSYIKENKKAYYRQLEYHSKGHMEVTEYLVYFLQAVRGAIQGTSAKLDRLLFRTRFWNAYQGFAFNVRQRKVVDRLLDGDFEGVLTVRKWARMTAVGYDTANADIRALLEVGVLVKTSEGERNKKFILNTRFSGF